MQADILKNIFIFRDFPLLFEVRFTILNPDGSADA